MIRLREDPLTSTALRQALEDAPCELPSSDEMRNLAEVIALRLRGPEPRRLNACSGTPKALRAAILDDTCPQFEPGMVERLWTDIRQAITTLSRNGRRPRVPSSWLSRRGRHATMVAAGVGMFSTLAAAGFQLFGIIENTGFGSQNSENARANTHPPKTLRATKVGSARGAEATHHLHEPSASSSTVIPTQTDLTENRPTSNSATVVRPSLKNRETHVAASPDENTSVNSGKAIVTEVQLLRSAWAQLHKGHPEVALAIAKEHETLYANGAFVQEREVLVIQALEQLGQAQEARLRATKFEQRFPDSPHRPLSDAGLHEP